MTSPRDTHNIADAVMEALDRHIRPLLGPGVSLTLLTSGEQGQDLFSDDEDPDGLLLAVAREVLEQAEVNTELQARRGCLKAVH